MKAEVNNLVAYLAEYLGVTIDDLKQKKRKKEIVTPRHKILAYLHSIKTGTMNNENIAAIFGQDHATVNHAVQSIKNDCFANASFKREWRQFVEYGDRYKLVLLPDPEPETQKEFMDKHSL